MISEKVLPMPNGFLRHLCTEDLHQVYIDGLKNPALGRYLELRRVKQNEKTLEALSAISRLMRCSSLGGLEEQLATSCRHREDSWHQ